MALTRNDALIAALALHGLVLDVRRLFGPVPQIESRVMPAINALQSVDDDDVESSGLTRRLKADDVEWVVNDNAELGVKIGNQFFWLYKGHSLVYSDATHEDGRPMHWRYVFKREFGECAHPINYADPTKIGTVSLSDSQDWARLPPDPDNS